ncbi:MAG: arabinosidase [Kiritimatiellaeota bacterium]|nr:arabinosidase [Kiritimatiellota bacterium]
MKTRDFIKWEEQSTRLVVPPGTRHGAALTVPGKVIEKLMAQKSKPSP